MYILKYIFRYVKTFLNVDFENTFQNIPSGTYTLKCVSHFKNIFHTLIYFIF